jgi:hypothetical protein
MSAYVVSDKHINYLVNAAIHYNTHCTYITWGESRAEFGNADEIARALLGENIKSVAYRYSEQPDLASVEAFRHRWDGLKAPDAVQVLKAIHCYEYQSCEHPRWAGSPAWSFVRQLERAAMRRVPGYEEAEWSID